MVISEGYDSIDEEDDEYDDSLTHIAINILPNKFVGQIFDRTGAPIYAVIAISIFMAFSNIFLTFDEMVEFNLFTYFIFFVIELIAYMILKHSEPNAPRLFEIPFGFCGGLTTVLIVFMFMSVCFFILVINDPILFGYACALNFGLILYYIISKTWCNRMHQNNILPSPKHDKIYDDDNHFDEELQPLI